MAIEIKQIPLTDDDRCDVGLIERFISKIATGPSGRVGFDDCWEWSASLFRCGYGRFHFRGRSLRAHRFSYSLFVGDIPEDLLVLHHCDNPKCVNFNHFFLGTTKDNAVDMAKKGRCRDSQGEKNPESKLTEKDVREIRMKLHAGAIPRDLTREYGVGRRHISKIKTGEIWSHITIDDDK